jgi:hypothetical protein
MCFISTLWKLDKGKKCRVLCVRLERTIGICVVLNRCKSVQNMAFWGDCCVLELWKVNYYRVSSGSARVKFPRRENYVRQDESQEVGIGR